MSGALLLLFGAAALWIAIHLGLAGSPLRWGIVARIGEAGFRGLFSLLSALSLGLLIWAYGRATQPDTFYGLWLVEEWMLWAPFLVMPIAILLLVCSMTPGNPTLAGAERALAGREGAIGIMRVTRHPMLWAFSLWAISHLVANGDIASQVFFGSFLVVSLAGMKSIDRKRARQAPEDWAYYASRTSILPFAAIAAGRNRFVLSEIGIARLALSVLAWVVLLGLHRLVTGASPLPF